MFFLWAAASLAQNVTIHVNGSTIRFGRDVEERDYI